MKNDNECGVSWRTTLGMVLTMIGVICMVVAVVGFMLVNMKVHQIQSEPSNYELAQQYCNAFDMELQYYSAEVQTIICVSENAKLTTKWQ